MYLLLILSVVFSCFECCICQYHLTLNPVKVLHAGGVLGRWCSAPLPAPPTGGLAGRGPGRVHVGGSAPREKYQNKFLETHKKNGSWTPWSPALSPAGVTRVLPMVRATLDKPKGGEVLLAGGDAISLRLLALAP